MSTAYRAQVGDDEGNTEHEQEVAGVGQGVGGGGGDKILISPDEWLWGTGYEACGWHYQNLWYMFNFFFSWMYEILFQFFL